MVRAATALLLLVAIVVGCAGTGASDPPPRTSEEPRALRVEEISSGAPARGPERPRVILAPSADALSREIGARVPDAGEGTYLAAYWGEKPTGGYSLAVRSARLRAERATVELALEEPPPEAMVTQALTYPYAVAVVRDLDPKGKRFSLVTGESHELDWPIRRANG